MTNYCSPPPKADLLIILRGFSDFESRLYRLSPLLSSSPFFLSICQSQLRRQSQLQFLRVVGGGGEGPRTGCWGFFFPTSSFPGGTFPPPPLKRKGSDYYGDKKKRKTLLCNRQVRRLLPRIKMETSVLYSTLICPNFFWRFVTWLPTHLYFVFCERKRLPDQ